MSGPIQAPRLSPEKARFWNALVSRLLPVQICLDSGTPNPPKAEISCPVPCVRVGESAYTLFVNFNGFWRLDFDNLDILRVRPELDQWLCADRENRFAHLPEGLIRAVLERLFLRVLDDISRFSGMPAFFVGAPKAVTQPRFSQYLDCLLRVEGERPVTSLVRLSWQDSSTLMPLLERLESLPLRAMSDAVRPLLPLLSFEAALEIGRMQLTWEEVRSLEPGCVLLPTILSPDRPSVRLAGGLRLVSSLNQCTLTLEHKETPSSRVPHGVQTMSDTAEKTAQDASERPLLGAEDLGSVELPITFELPGIKLSLAECSRLVPGTTFTLSSDAASLPVTILASGRPVAVGRLVDVGGTMGVQLTQLAGKSAQDSFTENVAAAEKAVD